MSGGGYFAQLGARVAVAAEPEAPLPMPERLSLDPEPVTEAPPRTPREVAPPSSSEFAAREPLYAPENQSETNQSVTEKSHQTQDADLEARDVSQQSTDSTVPEPPVQQELMPPAEQAEPQRSPTLEAPVEPPADVAQPSKPIATQEFDPPPSTDIALEQTDDLEPAREDMTPQDHLALFERYIDRLNGREPEAEVPDPRQPAPQPVEPPSEAPQSRAEMRDTPGPQPAPEPPRAPKLEIGEIIVTVREPVQPTPAPVPRISRALGAPPRRRRISHGLEPL